MHPLNTLKWAAVDFDGTLAESSWSAENPTHEPGEPIWSNVYKLMMLRAHRYKIIIHTARAWADYLVIEEWLNRYGIPFNRIVCGKLLAHVYIDDRGINADEKTWVRGSYVGE